VIRPELWETKVSRPATLDECIGDDAPLATADRLTQFGHCNHPPGC
jgi:hypothetical protein